MQHSNVGYLEVGSAATIKVLLTAYAFHGEDLLFLSVVGPHEKVNAVKAFVLSGTKVKIRSSYQTYGLESQKKSFEIVAKTKLVMTNSTHLIMAHKNIRSGELDKENNLHFIVDTADASAIPSLVMKRVAPWLKKPMFPEWESVIFQTAFSSGLIGEVSNSAGIRIYRVTIDERWDTIIKNALSFGAIPSIRTIYGGQS